MLFERDKLVNRDLLDSLLKQLVGSDYIFLGDKHNSNLHEIYFNGGEIVRQSCWRGELIPYVEL